MAEAVSRIQIYRPQVPLRKPFSHAAASRSVAEPVIVRISLANGIEGYGEGLPREYVTGETLDGCVQTIRHKFAPALVAFRPHRFTEVLETLEMLPLTDDTGNCITTARAAVELAILDAYGKHFGQGMEVICGWVGRPEWGLPGSADHARASAVLSSGASPKLAWKLRTMRWFGLRDFKVKIGSDSDADTLRTIDRVLGRSLRQGVTSLRADANGACQADDLESTAELLASYGCCAFEQPTAPGLEHHWPNAAMKGLAIIADESAVLPDDVQTLADKGYAAAINIRISKNGGLIPAIRLADMAAGYELAYQLGCMVGESAILTAAGRWFVHLVPNILFTELAYGRFLLRQSATGRFDTFSYGGKLAPVPAAGLGVQVDPEHLANMCSEPPVTINL